MRKEEKSMENWLKGKTAIIIGERDGVQGPSIAECLEAAGANVVYAVTECFVWTAAGTMGAENQARIKKIAESAKAEDGSQDIIVVLGASDLEGALISAETVTVGDPSFTGPLAGVSLGLPVYHILEPAIKEVVPKDIYEKNAGIWELTVDTAKIGQEFKAIREKNGRGGN